MKNGNKGLGHYDTKFTLAQLFKNQKLQRNFVQRIPACLRIYEHYKAGYSQSAKFVDAFTLAEVLITLAIIGIVSALVIPSVLKNYNDKKYNTARLKALKTFGEAGKMASINGEINGQPSARAFVENVLSKYLKIAKVCDTAEECGFPNEIQPSNPNANKLISDNIRTWKDLNNGIATKNNWSAINEESSSIYIFTVDGFFAKLFYNSNCTRNVHDNPVGSAYPYATSGACNSKECTTYLIDNTCINAIYDANGEKGPNHAGEDIGFVTTFWSGLKTTSIAPGLIPYNRAKAISDMGASYNSVAYNRCDNEAYKNLYVLPSDEELSSVVINLKLSSISSGYFWSRNIVPGYGNTRYYWGISTDGLRMIHDLYGIRSAWCVRR